MLREELQDILALLVVQLVDLLGEDTIDEQALPPCNRVDPNDRMRSLEVLIIVERASPVSSQGFAFGFGGSQEKVTSMFGGEAFEKLAVGRGESVVQLVPRSPECVCRGRMNTGLVGAGICLPPPPSAGNSRI